MSDNKVKTNLDAIEKLIVDGQKEVIKRIEAVEGELRHLDTKIDTVHSSLKSDLEKIDKKHDTNSQALYDLLQDTRKDVNRIETKLDAHIKQPAHA